MQWKLTELTGSTSRVERDGVNLQNLMVAVIDTIVKEREQTDGASSGSFVVQWFVPASEEDDDEERGADLVA